MSATRETVTLPCTKCGGSGVLPGSGASTAGAAGRAAAPGNAPSLPPPHGPVGAARLHALSSAQLTPRPTQRTVSSPGPGLERRCAPWLATGSTSRTTPASRSRGTRTERRASGAICSTRSSGFEMEQTLLPRPRGSATRSKEPCCGSTGSAASASPVRWPWAAARASSSRWVTTSGCCAPTTALRDWPRRQKLIHRGPRRARGADVAPRVSEALALPV